MSVLGKPLRRGIIFLLVAGSVAFCSVVANAQSGSPNGSPLRKLAEKRKLRFGTAASVGLLRNDADDGVYAKTTAAEFTMMEPENELKPPAIWQGDGVYDWTNADWLLGAPGQRGWAQAHKLAVRGHVLVYARDDGYTLPNWLRQQESAISPEQARKLLHDYIFAVVGRYKGKIAAWDVVNEAIDDQPDNGNPYNLRNSFWFRKLGPDFIKLAFQYAHEADPKAELYINEYGAEGLGHKSDTILAILKWLKGQKVFVTGAGMQYHLSASDRIAPGDDHYENAQRLKKAGFAFMITELDVSVPVSDPGIGYVVSDAADLQKQAEVYRAVLQLALDSPNCRGYQVWGFTDKHSWIPGFQRGKGAATLMDSEYKPKPAYTALQTELAR